MKKMIKILLINWGLIIILCLINKVQATSITSSPANPEVNKPVTITVSISNVNTVDITATISGAGTTGNIRLVDGSMTGDAKNFSKSITVTPTTTGIISVAISSNSNAVLNGEYVNVASSTNITVTEPSPVVEQPKEEKPVATTNKPTTTTTKPKEEVKKSNDSTLKELSIAEGIISPEFSKDVREYTLTVSNEITALNITATVNNNKATYSIKGNEEFIVGENSVIITVKAEDGSSSNYIIKVTKAREELLLKTLTIKYKSENGETVELPLTPIFAFNIYEYDLGEIEHTISDLTIEALANLEDANVEIIGNTNLIEGKNTIIVRVKIPKEVAEGEEASDEIKTYTLTVNKKAVPVPPTLMGRISNWFNNTENKITVWYTANTKQIVIVSLYSSLLLLGSVIIYMSIDYSKYKTLIEKVQKLSQMNQAETITEVQVPENIIETNVNENVETIEESTGTKETKKAGRHF